jgi:undecaprenyl-diphosphatase
MPTELRKTLAGIAVVAATLVVLLAVLYAGDSTGGWLDHWAWVEASTRFPESPLVNLLDSIGGPKRAALLVGLFAATCLLLRRPRLALVAGAGTLATVAVTTVLKQLVERTIGEGYLAYPSGHTGLATALGMVGGLLVADLLAAPPGVRLLLILTGTLVAGIVMATVQVSLNNHYFTDTIGGFGVAVVVVPTVALLTDLGADRWAKT